MSYQKQVAMRAWAITCWLYLTYSSNAEKDIFDSRTVI